MAYVRTWTEKEEAWGAPAYRIESELHATEEEVADLLVDSIIDEGVDNVIVMATDYRGEKYPSATVTTIDDYTEEDIEIEVIDMVDIKHLYEWWDTMTEEEYEAWEAQSEDKKRIDLCAALGILTPEARQKMKIEGYEKEYNDELEAVLSQEHLEKYGVKNVTTK